MFQSAKNYLFVPASGSNSGLFYELGEAGSYQTDAVVLISYQNPAHSKPAPMYYPILKVQAVDTGEINNELSAEIAVQLKAKTTKQTYIEKLEALKTHIQQGNIYEINYCIEFFAEQINLDPLSVFKKLYALTKAPYSALLKLDTDFVICCSPELFLKKEGETLISKPIKGTIKRGKSKVEDEALKETLHTSLKERTENVMAVDVARNDLSRVATKGSVSVNKLYNIETFETVHQMVSTVICKIKPYASFEHIIEATFPMASMTGAPKTRAMQLIDEFEDFERKNYSGSLGIIEANGDYTLSVIIRSIFYNQQTKQLSIAVGGAITYLSEPEKEYEECLLKAKALLKALDAELLI